MTRYSDNIYSGFQAPTSASSSKSAVVLRKIHTFGGTTANFTGTFPPGAENLTAGLYIVKAGTSATTSDKITVSAGGTNLIAITGIGSAEGLLGAGTTAGLGVMTVVASAAASLAVPAGSNNGGEIPYSIAYVAASAGAAAQRYRLHLTFNRADSNTLGVTA